MYVFESSRSYADCIRLVASGMGIIVQRIPEDFRSKRMLILVKDFEGYETFREYVSPGRNIRVCLDTLKEGKYSFNIYSYQEDLYWPFFSCVGPVFRKDAGGCVFLSTPFAVYDSLVVSSWPTDPRHLQNYLIPTDQFQTWDMEIAKLAQELSVRYLTTYAKMKAVHDYVAGNIAYDYDSLRSGEYASQDHSALGTLHRGRSVCQGYASLSVALLRAMGIPARLHGNIMTDFGKGELFMKHDIVISCVDTQECRAFISDWCVRTNTPMFELGFDGFNLNVTFFAPADGYVQVTDGRHIDRLPSSDGLFPIPENRMEVCLREEIGNGTFDGSRNSCSGFKMKDHELMKIPTIQTCSAMAAAILTTELVKYLSGKDTLRNKIIYYYGLRHEAMCFSYKPSKQCIIHQENIPVENIEVAKDDTLGEILRKISDKYCAQPLMSVTPFVISGHCASCGCEMTVGKLETEMYDDERWCPECRTRYADYSTRLLYPNQWKRTPFELTLSSRNEILAMRPCDIGIPEGDIVKVTLTSDEGICQKFLWLKSNLYFSQYNKPGGS